MLPLEVRIVPTYAVAANVLSPIEGIANFLFNGPASLLSLMGLRLPMVELKLPEWNLLNSYTGSSCRSLPLRRDLPLPSVLPDGSGRSRRSREDGWRRPLRFFVDVLLPLSKTNMAALATIMFVYAWNQYLWPLLITTRPEMTTATMQLQKLVPGPLFGQPPVWNEAMAGTLIVMLPPLLVVIFMQGYFVRGLISTDK